MPNRCENDLTISGTEEEACAFFEEAHGTREDGEPLLLDFNKFVPEPETFTRDVIRDEPHSAYIKDDSLWCYWRKQHWGTHWQPDRLRVQEALDGHLLTFDTASSPPLKVVLAMSKRFPTLMFELRYFEGGDGFNGLFVCEGGEVTANKVGDYFGTRGG